MPFNGSGTFAVYTPGTPFVTGTVISSTVVNNVDTDFATGLSTALLKDGTQTATAVIPFALGITLAGGGTFAKYLAPATYTPTVTLVGGTGNTVPVYTTNEGRWEQIAKRVFVDVALDGDGGAEGAGTGTVTIALPVAVGTNEPSPSQQVVLGTALNNATRYILIGTLTPGATTIAVAYFSSISAIAALTGADQNNATRGIRLKFEYETD